MHTDLQPFRNIATNVDNNKIDRPVVMSGKKVKDLGIFGRIVKFISQIGNQYQNRIKRNEKVIQHLRKTVSDCYGDLNPTTQKINSSLDELSTRLNSKHKSIFGKDVKQVLIDAGVPITGAGDSPLEILRNALTEDTYYAHLDQLKKADSNSEFQKNNGLTDVEMVALSFATSTQRDKQYKLLSSYLVDTNARESLRASAFGDKFKGLDAIFDAAVDKLPDAKAEDYVSNVNLGSSAFNNKDQPFSWRQVVPDRGEGARNIIHQKIKYESGCAKLLNLDTGSGPRTFLAFPPDSLKTVQYKESEEFDFPEEVFYKIDAKKADQKADQF